jgi:ribosome assembly protein RRB1
VWRPGIDPLGEDEELDYDPTAYDCLHKFALEWPCLSFDIVRDDLGGPRSTFPHTVFMLAGTQVRTEQQRRLQQQQEPQQQGQQQQQQRQQGGTAS